MGQETTSYMSMRLYIKKGRIVGIYFWLDGCLVIHMHFCLIYILWSFTIFIFQVFPLLIEKFSLEEQASLVWQFFCSIPVYMMAQFLPWLSSSISPDESQDLQKCLIKVVPEEKLLQQV